MLGLLATTEVRWFLPGEIPGEVQTWFGGLGEVLSFPERTDIYLPSMGSGLGIKLRDGRLEIKVRRASRGCLNLGPGISGQIESWIKWGFGFKKAALKWKPVRKARQIFFFQVDDQGNLRPSEPGILPRKGGGVELTQVWLEDGISWWTVGIEVFGPFREQVNILDLIAGFVFSGAGKPDLSADASASYPAWLAELASSSLRP